jgi:hypothetical protein
LPMIEYEAAFKLCDNARRLSEEARWVLHQHIAQHRC